MTYAAKYPKMSAADVIAEAHSRWYDARMDGTRSFGVPKAFFWEMCAELDLWKQLGSDGKTTSYKGLSVYIREEPVAVDALPPQSVQPAPVAPPVAAVLDTPEPLTDPTIQTINPATGAPTPPEEVVINPLTGERVQKEVIINPVTGKPIE